MSPDETGERARNARRGKGETKKAPRGTLFLAGKPQWLPVVLLVVLLSADAPEVCLHGLCTGSGVQLREEVLLINDDLGEVGLACPNHLCYGGETLARLQLLRARLGGTLAMNLGVTSVVIFATSIDRAELPGNLTRDIINRIEKINS